jgi:hypothetical protein
MIRILEFKRSSGWVRYSLTLESLNPFDTPFGIELRAEMLVDMSSSKGLES